MRFLLVILLKEYLPFLIEFRQAVHMRRPDLGNEPVCRFMIYLDLLSEYSDKGAYTTIIIIRSFFEKR